MSNAGGYSTPMISVYATPMQGRCSSRITFGATARATNPLVIVLSLFAVGVVMIDGEVILFKLLDAPLFLLIVVRVTGDSR